jgi:hypothetical protein
MILYDGFSIATTQRSVVLVVAFCFCYEDCERSVAMIATDAHHTTPSLPASPTSRKGAAAEIRAEPPRSPNSQSSGSTQQNAPQKMKPAGQSRPPNAT